MPHIAKHQQKDTLQNPPQKRSSEQTRRFTRQHPNALQGTTRVVAVLKAAAAKRDRDDDVDADADASVLKPDLPVGLMTYTADTSEIYWALFPDAPLRRIPPEEGKDKRLPLCAKCRHPL
ncbi:hypothetical protein cyc_08607 [Cyclospora cayetanensis]|uniref:Uncharacterized protein n=1 Tax=Cyclospora cayetanensis TaxID=88456 RepID=A0A1D3CZL0_9EIME|nr:hypothetical protein cyc_08607 [Cyclospora cayetanensis]